MKVLPLIAAVSLATAPIAGASGHVSPDPEPEFTPAELISASQIAYPIRSVALGLVLLQVTVESDGSVGRIAAIRDIPSLTEPAEAAVKGWTFQPATLRGQKIRSRVRIAVVFNPFAFASPNIPFQAASAEKSNTNEKAGMLALQPPNVTSAEYSLDPFNAASALQRSVVLQLKISEDGTVRNVKPVVDVAPFTVHAIDAVNQWQFEAARYREKAVAATAFVAFVFQLPPANNR